MRRLPTIAPKSYTPDRWHVARGDFEHKSGMGAAQS